ncbi:hypothetical protein PGT21_031755 [Puccinia graminis f. sp. tritici]|uniref:Uncharacterized protein n=1 Tax=Puccinia graminis f. sp. tritici TaxID=56615 RepID=A0A5B0QC08_PUCGR|nr:hypothetical protein PGT21_031755 [Puccinia graminis f. sp. tritici]
MEAPDRQTSDRSDWPMGPTLLTHTPTYQDRLILANARLVWPSSSPAPASPPNSARKSVADNAALGQGVQIRASNGLQCESRPDACRSADLF